MKEPELNRGDIIEWHGKRFCFYGYEGYTRYHVIRLNKNGDDVDYRSGGTCIPTDGVKVVGRIKDDAKLLVRMRERIAAQKQLEAESLARVRKLSKDLED